MCLPVAATVKLTRDASAVPGLRGDPGSDAQPLKLPEEASHPAGATMATMFRPLPCLV